MFNFFTFVLTLILIYLPAHNLTDKRSPCSSFFVAKKPDSAKSDKLLYKEIVSLLNLV